MITRSPIPIHNIYYLLAYAWDQFRGKQAKDISATDCPDSINLLAYLLATNISKLATRGLDKNYHLIREETARLRGRFDLMTSYRRGTHLSGRLVCEFDELTSDTLPNQILKTTCEQLVRASKQLTKENISFVKHSRGLLGDISSIHLSRGTFKKVQLHRNNRHYRLLLNICELIYDCFMPDETSGCSQFIDVLKHETRMHQLFEKFVLGFAKQHCVGATVRAVQIQWVGSWDQDVAKVLPRMQTDVAIEYPSHKTILDCKFYREALVTNKDRERLHSSHLYQLSAYLANKAHDRGWEDVRGILLYPAVSHRLKLKFELLGHPVEIHSIDLDQDWREIHDDLVEVLQMPG